MGGTNAVAMKLFVQRIEDLLDMARSVGTESGQRETGRSGTLLCETGRQIQLTINQFRQTIPMELLILRILDISDALLASDASDVALYRCLIPLREMTKLLDTKGSRRLTEITIRNDFGEAFARFRTASQLDVSLLLPSTLNIIIGCLDQVTAGLSVLSNLPQNERESLYWLIHDGVVLVQTISKYCARNNFYSKLPPYIAYAILAVESTVRLLDTRFLKFRMSVYETLVRFEVRALQFEKAKSSIERARKKLEWLREMEAADEVPPSDEQILIMNEAGERLDFVEAGVNFCRGDGIATISDLPVERQVEIGVFALELLCIPQLAPESKKTAVSISTSLFTVIQGCELSSELKSLLFPYLCLLVTEKVEDEVKEEKKPAAGKKTRPASGKGGKGKKERAPEEESEQPRMDWGTSGLMNYLKTVEDKDYAGLLELCESYISAMVDLSVESCYKMCRMLGGVSPENHPSLTILSERIFGIVASKTEAWIAERDVDSIRLCVSVAQSVDVYSTSWYTNHSLLPKLALLVSPVLAYADNHHMSARALWGAIRYVERLRDLFSHYATTEYGSVEWCFTGDIPVFRANSAGKSYLGLSCDCIAGLTASGWGELGVYHARLYIEVFGIVLDSPTPEEHIPVYKSLPDQGVPAPPGAAISSNGMLLLDFCRGDNQLRALAFLELARRLPSGGEDVMSSTMVPKGTVKTGPTNAERIEQLLRAAMSCLVKAEEDMNKQRKTAVDATVKMAQDLIDAGSQSESARKYRQMVIHALDFSKEVAGETKEKKLERSVAQAFVKSKVDGVLGQMKIASGDGTMTSIKHAWPMGPQPPTVIARTGSSMYILPTVFRPKGHPISVVHKLNFACMATTNNLSGIVSEQHVYLGGTGIQTPNQVLLRVSGLSKNAEYIFATSTSLDDGSPVATMSLPSAGVVSGYPLPFSLLWAWVVGTSHGLSISSVTVDAASYLINRFLTDKVKPGQAVEGLFPEFVVENVATATDQVRMAVADALLCLAQLRENEARIVSNADDNGGCETREQTIRLIGCAYGVLAFRLACTSASSVAALRIAPFVLSYIAVLVEAGYLYSKSIRYLLSRYYMAITSLGINEIVANPAAFSSYIHSSVYCGRLFAKTSEPELSSTVAKTFLNALEASPLSSVDLSSDSLFEIESAVLVNSLFNSGDASLNVSGSLESVLPVLASSVSKYDHVNLDVSELLKVAREAVVSNDFSVLSLRQAGELCLAAFMTLSSQGMRFDAGKYNAGLSALAGWIEGIVGEWKEAVKMPVDKFGEVKTIKPSLPPGKENDEAAVKKYNDEMQDYASRKLQGSMRNMKGFHVKKDEVTSKLEGTAGPVSLLLLVQGAALSSQCSWDRSKIEECKVAWNSIDFLCRFSYRSFDTLDDMPTSYKKPVPKVLKPEPVADKPPKPEKGGKKGKAKIPEQQTPAKGKQHVEGLKVFSRSMVMSSRRENFEGMALYAGASMLHVAESLLDPEHSSEVVGIFVAAAEALMDILQRKRKDHTMFEAGDLTVDVERAISVFLPFFDFVCKVLFTSGSLPRLVELCSRAVSLLPVDSVGPILPVLLAAQKATGVDTTSSERLNSLLVRDAGAGALHLEKARRAVIRNGPCIYAVQEYRAAVEMLRAKHDIELLIQALNELGDLYLSGSKDRGSGGIGEILTPRPGGGSVIAQEQRLLRGCAAQWEEAVDQFWSVPDVVKQWRTIEPAKLKADYIISNFGVRECLNVACIVVKLAQHIYAKDVFLHSEAVLFAGKMFEVALGSSVAHPQAANGYRCYTIERLLPGVDLFADPFCLSYDSFIAGISYVSSTLVSCQRSLEALPVISLYVYFSKILSAEAYMYASLLKGIALAQLGFYNDAVRQIRRCVLGEVNSTGFIEEVDPSFEKEKSFDDSLPSSHESNLQCLSWLVTFECPETVTSDWTRMLIEVAGCIVATLAVTSGNHRSIAEKGREILVLASKRVQDILNKSSEKDKDGFQETMDARQLAPGQRPTLNIQADSLDATSDMVRPFGFWILCIIQSEVGSQQSALVSDESLLDELVGTSHQTLKPASGMSCPSANAMVLFSRALRNHADFLAGTCGHRLCIKFVKKALKVASSLNDIDGAARLSLHLAASSARCGWMHESLALVRTIEKQAGNPAIYALNRACAYVFLFNMQSEAMKPVSSIIHYLRSATSVLAQEVAQLGIDARSPKLASDSVHHAVVGQYLNALLLQSDAEARCGNIDKVVDCADLAFALIERIGEPSIEQETLAILLHVRARRLRDADVDLSNLDERDRDTEEEGVERVRKQRILSPKEIGEMVAGKDLLVKSIGLTCQKGFRDFSILHSMCMELAMVAEQRKRFGFGDKTVEKDAAEVILLAMEAGSLAAQKHKQLRYEWQSFSNATFNEEEVPDWCLCFLRSFKKNEEPEVETGRTTAKGGKSARNAKKGASKESSKKGCGAASGPGIESRSLMWLMASLLSGDQSCLLSNKQQLGRRITELHEALIDMWEPYRAAARVSKEYLETDEARRISNVGDLKKVIVGHHPIVFHWCVPRPFWTAADAGNILTDPDALVRQLSHSRIGSSEIDEAALDFSEEEKPFAFYYLCLRPEGGEPCVVRARITLDNLKALIREICDFALQVADREQNEKLNKFIDSKRMSMALFEVRNLLLQGIEVVGHLPKEAATLDKYAAIVLLSRLFTADESRGGYEVAAEGISHIQALTQ